MAAVSKRGPREAPPTETCKKSRSDDFDDFINSDNPFDYFDAWAQQPSEGFANCLTTKRI
jgi:hypothetical protein